MPKNGAIQHHEADMDIGARLKAARTARQLSQRELARKSGVTNGLISQIEQNRSSPSISSLKRILDAIPISMADFFAPEVGPNKVFHRAEELIELNPARMLHLAPEQAQLISLRQISTGVGHSIQMMQERYAPGADTGEEMYSHEAEEAGIVIEGQIELTVDGETCLLGKGDAYIFDSRKPHRFCNTGACDCVIVSACTPVSF